jgi:hypothetical protein
LDFEQYFETSKAKALQQKIQVQPVVKVAAGSKIRKCQCCKTVIYTLFWYLISEDRLHRSLVHKNQFTKSEGEHDKTKRIIQKEDFKSS